MNVSLILKGWSIEWIFQWRDILKLLRYNWINFDVCHIGFEAGSYKGWYVEFNMIILGLGFWVDWSPPTESQREFFGVMEKIIKEHKSKEEK